MFLSSIRRHKQSQGDGQPAFSNATIAPDMRVNRFLPEDALLFILARQDFRDSHLNQVAAVCSGRRVDWNVVFAIAMQHGVAPLVGRNLLQCAATCQIPPHILESFRVSFLSNMARPD